MLSKEVVAQIRQVKLKTSKALNGLMLGVNKASSKGFGFDFDQLREYCQGDDLRLVDWRSSARSNQMLTKQYLEERNYRILIALDVSSSVKIMTKQGFKYDFMAQAAAIFGLVAEHCHDQVGLVLFSDQIEFELPIKHGKTHGLKLLETVFDFKQKIAPKNCKTDLKLVFTKLAQTLNKKTLVLIVSDFIDDQHAYFKPLQQLGAKHDVVAVRYVTPQEKLMPNVGLLPVVDPETGITAMIDTSFLASSQRALNSALHNRLKLQNELFKKNKIDLLELHDFANLAPEIVNFFRQRLNR